MHFYKINRGILQGSVLGSLLWNVIYNDLLKQTQPDGVSMVTFADDVALIVVAKDIKELQYYGDESI